MTERDEVGTSPRSMFGARWHTLSNTARSFHRDECGLKAVEMLLLLFVATIILIGFLKVFFPEVLKGVKDKVMDLLGMEVTG